MEIKTGEIFRIINNKTGESEGVYQRGNYDQHDFSSVESARSSNCHDTYRDKVQYGINKYRVTIELIEENVDPASKEEKEKAIRTTDFEKEADERGLELFRRMEFIALKELLYNEQLNGSKDS